MSKVLGLLITGGGLWLPRIGASHVRYLVGGLQVLSYYSEVESLVYLNLKAMIILPLMVLVVCSRR